jgi:hypothetical protein
MLIRQRHIWRGHLLPSEGARFRRTLDKLVSAMRNGHNEIRATMLRENAAKRGHLNGEVVFADGHAPPDMANDFVTRHGPVTVFDEVFKDVEGAGMQRHGLRAHHQDAARQVHAKAAEGDRSVKCLHRSTLV